MPGIGEVIEGAIQHAPQPARQSMLLQVEEHARALVRLRRVFARGEEQAVGTDVPGVDQLVAFAPAPAAWTGWICRPP